MKVCLDFRNVVSLGVLQLVDLIENEDKEFLSFLATNKVKVQLHEGKGKYPSFIIDHDSAITEDFIFMSVLSKA